MPPVKPDPIPECPKVVPGEWKQYFNPRFVHAEGEGWTWKFICLEPGCGANLSISNSSSTLDKQYDRKHRATYNSIKAKQQPSGNILLQTTLPRQLTPQKQQQLVFTSLNWIISQQLPFTILDSKEFKQLACTISPYVPTPSSSTIRNSLHAHRISLSDKLRHALSKTLLYGSITADGWSSTGMKPYLGVTLHWIDDTFRYHECALAMEQQKYPHTAEATSVLIRRILGSRGTEANAGWDIFDRVCSVTTDSAAVMIKTVQLLGSEQQTKAHIPCFAHGLHNCVVTVLDSIQGLKELKTKCHGLATLFHSSPKMAQYLYSSQQESDPTKEPIAVVMDVPTRWNSTLDMMQRLVDLKFHLQRVSYLIEDARIITKLANLIPTEDEWGTIVCLIAMLKPFYHATNNASSSKTGLAAYIAPWVEQLREDIEDVDTLGNRTLEAAKRKLLAQIKKRFVISNTLLFASALHPTFNNLFFCTDNTKEAIMILLRHEYDRHNRIAANVAALAPAPTPINETPTAARDDSEESTGLGRLLKRRRMAAGQAPLVNVPPPDDFDRYFEVNLGLKMVDPIVWWRENSKNFPKMTFLARKYLSIPSTSVASERMFSFSGGVVTDKRSRLAATAVGDMVFSHYALKFLDSFYESSRPQ